MTEKEILKFWKKNQIFKKSLRQRRGKKFYSFFDGPPFATGLPHYGHILASTIKDVVGRYWTMKGYYVPRRWGWDCHGLPIENIIEKELGISGKKEIEKLGIEKFNSACRGAVLKYVREWSKMIEHIGRWVDFENSYKTMDSTYMESVWWALKEIYKKGLIYEGRKVLLYCPRCETPISNFEVAMDNSYADVKEETVTVRFKLLKNDKFPEPTYVLAWTTTPWTLPSNIALAVGEDIAYVLAKKDDDFYILAKNRLKEIDKELKVEKSLSGKELVGLRYEPLYSVIEDKKAYQIYPADFVNTLEGTGVVHTAVVYGEDDYNLGLKFGLPTIPLLDERGYFNEKAPDLLKDTYFKKADKIIINDLDKRGLIFKKEKHTHSYPFCWRCGTTLYYNAIPAWFINVQKIKKELLKNNESINFYPSHLKHGRFAKGIEEAPDWNISRNRYWATALPIWKCEKCKNITFIGSLKELQEKAINYGEVYESKEIEKVDLHKDKVDKIKIRCTCGEAVNRIPEVVDSWTEASSMPFAEIHFPFENKGAFSQRFPADFVAEYIAQTRAWFYTMHVISTILFGNAPFKNVVTTGTVLNEKGEKLSKSRENYPDPEEVIEKYGVDALRFYLISSVVMKAENLLFAENEVNEVQRKVVLLSKNILSFYKLYPLKKKGELPPTKDLGILDRWILARFNEFRQKVTEYLDNYNLIKSSREIVDFVNEFSTWYLRRSRERFKNKNQNGLKVFYFTLLNFTKIIAPFMPFLSEDIYQELNGEKESVHLEDWPRELKDYEDEKILDNMYITRRIAATALSMRAEKGIKVREPLGKMQINFKLDKEYLDLLKDEVNAEEIQFRKDFPKKIGAKKIVAVGIDKELDIVHWDMEITKERKEKGLARELIREINAARKKEGMTIKDDGLILLNVDNKVKNILQKYEKEILNNTLSKKIEYTEKELPYSIKDKEFSIRLDIKKL